MFGRIWQGTMIAAARSPRLKRFMQGTRATSFLAGKYVAGRDVAEGVASAQALMAQDGIRASLFFMGEYVDTPELVEENVAQKLAVAEALGATGLDLHVSVDPTQIGHHIDPGSVRARAEAIAAAIAEQSGGRQGITCMMIDMEDESVTGPTIALHDALAGMGFPMALTLQAYLKRTAADLDAQIRRGGRVRLVRGAFVGSEDVAYTRVADIKANYRRLIDRMFSTGAREAGFYPIVATHDTDLHEYAIARAEIGGWPKDGYEFEMLLGVREDVARALVARGERVRLYLPFGSDWWPYAVRRIGEYPGNARLLVKSLFS